MGGGGTGRRRAISPFSPLGPFPQVEPSRKSYPFAGYMVYGTWQIEVSVKLVKQVLQQCAGVVPTSFALHSNGPSMRIRRLEVVSTRKNVHPLLPTACYAGYNGPCLSSTSLYYFFDGSTSGSWRTHDPCGKNQANQSTGVANPHGNVFVR